MSLEPDNQTPVRACPHGAPLGERCLDCEPTQRKKLSVKEFREKGYLQELNRKFLHPLGLALEVQLHKDGTESFGQVWDSRDDPEGMIYGPDMIDARKARNILNQTIRKAQNRAETLGYIIQPANT